MVRVLNKKVSGVPAGAVYVGRPTQWGNPFAMRTESERALVVRRFEQYAAQRLVRERGWLEPLRGKDLVCWCAPRACHADVLARLANGSGGGA
ncbi:MAG TPA: DUF4326 domain-containing protein [Caulobacteraceae bacterium]|nr:DUF4326 domain-containing protein [Caulobacteraceae bacterium]